MIAKQEKYMNLLNEHGSMFKYEDLVVVKTYGSIIFYFSIVLFHTDTMEAEGM